MSYPPIHNLLESVVQLEKKAGLNAPSSHEVRLAKLGEKKEVMDLTTRQRICDKKTVQFLELFQIYGTSPQPEFYR
jgi:hypothetical protein